MLSCDIAKKEFLIVGGGTAGWMAANLLAKKLGNKGASISLLESPDIPTVGVGEGSTPQLKGFMRDLGIKESEWMPACQATYKVGIRFDDWSRKPGFDSYFHPFPAQPDDYSAPAFFYNSFVRRKGIDVEAHPDRFFLATCLADKQLSPIPSYNFPFEVEYGYHFDAAKLGVFLKSKAVSAGVKYLQGTMTQAKLSSQGDIECIRLDSGDVIHSDYFVDCTGFSSLLIEKTLGVGFHSFRENLFNDSAVVVATEQSESFDCHTTSTALSNGWRWSIPLTNRIGNGYVYSSQYCSQEDAEAELKLSLGLSHNEHEVKHLKMRVGRIDRHWYKNCLAVGLSQGFIEPLEATALHLVQETIESFIDAFEKGGYTDKHQNAFNSAINKRFEAVRDYIVCHYRVSSRFDSQYWRDNANNENLSSNLRTTLEAWMAGEDMAQVLEKLGVSNYYPNMSWHCLLAGYGVFPDHSQLVSGNELAHKHDMSKIKDFISRCANNFDSHFEQLKR